MLVSRFHRLPRGLLANCTAVTDSVCGLSWQCILPGRNKRMPVRWHNGPGQTGQVGKSGGLLLPGAPRTALIAYAATASASLSLALVIRPDNGGTMPSEKSVFTTRVEPVSPPQCPAGTSRKTGGGAGHCPRVHYAYSTNRLSP